MKIVAAIILSTAFIANASALEVTAGGNNIDRIQSDLQLQSMRSTIQGILSELQAIKFCNNAGKTYAPGNSSADANGCVAVTSTSTATPALCSKGEVLVSNGNGGTDCQRVQLSCKTIKVGLGTSPVDNLGLPFHCPSPSVPICSNGSWICPLIEIPDTH